MGIERSDGAIAALWGFAEATVFFVVPDVWLTYVAARRGAAAALVAGLLAAVGAALGGAVLWTVGAHAAAWARSLLDLVPAIGPDMIAGVGAEIASGSWPLALLHGSLSGVPYKIYAVEAGAANVAALPFVLASVPIRMVRFAATACLAALAAHLLARRGWARWTRLVWALAWVVFYAVYWALVA